MNRLMRTLAIGLSAAACFPAAESLAQKSDPAGQPPAVTIADGTLRGFTKSGVNIFLGIPYAAPPVGDLRWQPPQPANGWSGSRDATHFASTCAQVSELGAFAGPSSVSEDCLYLNVFTTPNTHPGAKKPVIVWLHGGGNLDGESNDYDGSKLATGGPGGVETVVVTLNNRLGWLGQFAHPAINAEGHPWGNYTVLDQIAALRWVQRNIEAFGGDPSKVALGGQSTGADDTAAIMLSPLGKGLFTRAIFESTPAYPASLPSAATAIEGGKTFAATAGCPGSDANTAKCLRSLSVARILQLQGTPKSIVPYLVYQPFVDGTIVPITPEQAWASGQFNKVPVLGGGTRDEDTFFVGVEEYFSDPQAPMTAAQFSASVAEGASCSGCTGKKIPAGAAALYPLSKYDGDTTIAYVRSHTDIVKCQELHVLQKLSAHVATYAYDFTYPNAPYNFPKMPGFKPLAAHTIDIQFLFNQWHGGNLGVNVDQETGMPRELNAAETKLSDQLVAAWTNFANTGNPNGTGNSPWPKLAAGPSGRYFVENIPISTKPVSQFRSEYQCDFWDAHLTY